MRGSKANQGLIKSEVNLWPGALVLFEQRKKHVCARLFYNEKERLVFMSATPSCRRATLNAVSDIRRELRALGAERIEREKRARD